MMYFDVAVFEVLENFLFIFSHAYDSLGYIVSDITRVYLTTTIIRGLGNRRIFTSNL